VFSYLTVSTSHIEWLYKQHHNWLFCWLRKKLGCESNAADIAHDTFLRLFTSSQPLTDIEQPRAFLTSTAKNIIIDKARRHAVEKAFLEQLALRAEQETLHYPSPELIHDAIELLTSLSYILSSVPAKAAEAFRLHYLEGMKQSGVAEIMQVSSRTVRSYLALVLVQINRLEEH
jgi:RNA polymerase sigma factor (sigma-70 family)